MSIASLPLEDVIIATFCALDDALKHSGHEEVGGKLIARPGPPPAVSDTEILCLAMLQELLGFESDAGYAAWVENRPEIAAHFPRRLSRQNFADRRALLTPLIRRLSGAFCQMNAPEPPPFSSSTRIRSMSADWCEPNTKRTVLMGCAKSATAPRSSGIMSASGNT